MVVRYNISVYNYFVGYYNNKCGGRRRPRPKSFFEANRRMNKKVIAVVIAASVIMGQGAVVFAEPYTQEQIQQSRNEYDAIEDKIAALEEQLYVLDEEIGSVKDAIEQNNNEIAALQVKITETQQAIEVAKAELKAKQDLYDAKMRTFYKTGGQTSYLSLIFEAEGFSDFISRIQAIGKLMDMDQRIIAELNEKKAELDNKVAELDTQVRAVEGLQAVNQTKLAELDVKQTAQNAVVAEAKAERSKIQVSLDDREWSIVEYPISVINNSNNISDIRNSVNTLVGLRNQIVSPNIDKKVEAAINKGTNKITELQAPASTTSRGEGAPSASASSLINYAYQFLGTPYVWGGTTPKGFDCSGFTQYVFKHFGYSIGRTTGAQINAGRKVSRAEMQPGDLIFTHAGHVGIYIGNNKFIHSPHTGDVVKVSSVYKFYAARRILN